MFGHVGCGKSTELRQLAVALHHPDRYWVVHVDLVALIDPQDVRFSDVWLAAVGELMRNLEQDGLVIPDKALHDFQVWFSERILSHESLKDVSGGLSVEAEAGIGIASLARLFGRITAALRVGSSYKDTLRTVVRNTFDKFAVSLNTLLSAATLALRAAGKARRILFVIDGADRFRAEDWKRFFVHDVNPLTRLDCFAVYAAPMALKVSGHRLDTFKCLVLPMVKILEADGITRRVEAFDALRELVLKRCHHTLIADVQVLDRMIEFSGGHLRDLLRLLHAACINTKNSIVDTSAVDAAIADLASEFRDKLTYAHYATLVRIDRRSTNEGTNDMLADLVDKGALLEYNAGSWRQSHPIVRTLAGYRYAASIEQPSTVMEVA